MPYAVNQARGHGAYSKYPKYPKGTSKTAISEKKNTEARDSLLRTTFWQTWDMDHASWHDALGDYVKRTPSVSIQHAAEGLRSLERTADDAEIKGYLERLGCGAIREKSLKTWLHQVETFLTQALEK